MDKCTKFTVNILKTIVLSSLLFFSCKPKDAKVQKVTQKPKSTIIAQHKTPDTPKVKLQLTSLDSLPDTTFVRLANYDTTFVYDLRYATTNNFLKTKVYNCAECYTRVKTAKALIKANKDFIKKGFKIKFYDCYRPNAVQHKMWKIYPNPQYVANPYKGSIHNKGGAVDITLVTLQKDSVDMGTDFDFFGKKAHHDFTNLSPNILQNRQLLKKVMQNHGFNAIRTEWWHYNLSGSHKNKVANFVWPCN